MKRSDYVIDNSPSGEEERFLIQEAEKLHGTDYISQLIDKSLDDEDVIRNVKMAVDTPPANPNNRENKPMIDVPGLRDLTTPDQWYGGLKTLTALGKPVAALTTPLTEAARLPFKYVAENFGENTSQTPPINTMAEEGSIYPSDRAGLGLLLRDAANAFGIQTEPMIDVQSEKYPKLAQFMKQMTDPTNVGGAVLDIAAGSKFPAPKIIQGGASLLDDMGQSSRTVQTAMNTNKAPVMTLESAADYIRSISKDKTKLAELERSGRIYELAHMVQEQPDKYLHQFQPNKIYENIMGDLLPDEATRIGKTGELSKMNQFQENLIENIPADNYVVPREELRLAALEELRGQQLEAGQMASAERIINRNIPVTQPDPAMINRINSVTDATWKIDDLGKAVESERMTRLNQLNMQKNAMFGEAASTPMQLDNPAYRPELQWLSDLPLETDQSNVFPRRTQTNSTLIGKETSGHGLIPGYERNIMTETDLGREFNPTPRNQNILDIAEGKQNQPSMIDNPEYSSRMGQAVEQISAINREIERLSDSPISSVNNSRLLGLIDEKQRLEGFVYESANPEFPTTSEYMNHISRLNEEPIGYASNMRKLGNKLREPVMPGEVSTDIAAKNAAGRALEQAARNAQNEAMGFMDPADMAIYNQQNKKISNLLSMRDLTQANLQSPTTNAPTPWMPSTWARGVNRYVKPSIQELGSMGINQLSGQLDNGLMSPGAAGLNLGAGEFLANKSGINNFKIPRTSDEVFANQDMVRAKVEREFGPEVAMQMDSITNSADFVNFMTDLANMNPMAFTPDPYNRFNGIIREPILKGKALEDTVKNKGMRAIDKANAVEELMLNNKFHGVPQE